MLQAAASSSCDPFDLVVSRLRAQNCVIRPRSTDSVRAQCPAHQDQRPSLVVTRRADRVLMKCFAGCAQRHVVHALGLQYADLFADSTPREAPMIVAQYEYLGLDGELLARKVRTDRKTFRWQTPDGDGWQSGLHGQVVGLYRLPDLIDERHVLIVEGEKAVDRLWSLGVPATCGPSGASQWLSAWTDSLWRAGCCEAIIVPDHDTPGRRHARRVAETCYGFTGATQGDDRDDDGLWDGQTPTSLLDASIAPLKVKLLELPDLRPGQDIVDFLDVHDVAELKALIAVTPYWHPGLDEERQRDRRREQTRARVRAHRERRRAEQHACNAANVRTTCNAANVRTPVTLDTCNAANVRPVTRNAVTQCERTSRYVTKVGTSTTLRRVA